MDVVEVRQRDGAVWRTLLLGTTVALALALARQLSAETQLVARAALWAAAAAVALTATRGRRPEPSSAWVAIGAGLLLVGGSWFIRWVLADLRVLGTWADLFSGAGLFTMGFGLMLAGRGRRERIALFDGALLAGAVATFAWAILVAPLMTGAGDSPARFAAGGHVLGGVLVLGVGVALILAERDERSAVGPHLLVLLLVMLLAAVGWGWQGLSGREQALAGAASWLLAPMIVVQIAMTREPRLAPAGGTMSTGTLLTPIRFVLLVMLTILPAVTVGALRAAPSMHDQQVPVAMGLWVTVASVIILAMRIRAVGGFAVEDERAVAADRFTHLIEHSADVVCVVDPHGVIRYLSPSTRRVFAHDPDTLVGQHVTEFIEDATSERVHHLMQLAIEGKGRPVPVRLGVVAGDGLSRPAEGSITDLTAIPSVGGLVVTLRDVSERVALEAELKRAALEDPLTGLANRTLLSNRIQHALAQQTRGAGGVALLFLDLDEFKAVNDTHGHAAGDRVLKIVAERLRSVVRDVDTPGRLGGDEFAVVLEGLPSEDVEAAAQHVVDRLFREFRDPVPVGNDLVLIRASIGIAVASSGMTVDSLVQSADMAMYAAKGAGGSSVAVFRPEMADAPLAPRRAIED